MTASQCAYCTDPATAILTAQGGTGPITHRAALTCPAHHHKAHTWAARAGPVTEQPLTPPDQELATLF
jgi:hypothetical protein